MPHTVFGAVDSIEARHQISKIYAPLTLDGSTGGMTGTTIGLAEATPSGPCLRCYFPELPPAPTPSFEQQLSDKTGLDIALLANGDHVLSADNLKHLPTEGARLRQRRSMPCWPTPKPEGGIFWIQRNSLIFRVVWRRSRPLSPQATRAATSLFVSVLYDHLER